MSRQIDELRNHSNTGLQPEHHNLRVGDPKPELGTSSDGSPGELSRSTFGGMSAVIKDVSHHLVGHCDCCDGYRSLKFQDQELGFLCVGCLDHSIVADIELNCGGYDLCRPKREANK
jgi:hypothetical protein